MLHNNDGSFNTVFKDARDSNKWKDFFWEVVTPPFERSSIFLNGIKKNYSLLDARNY